ncbi:hypothetical protein FSPOR_6093 [Fusarium sporotrichioides]|uniref:DUF6546 domain-containing protein n=1 Tax=Fusarium sporotrichioides TaxID=5514 RepID=A0A395S4J4_FUSSP|nr:hypothetical protein FSPOR_6093 [Fusarium sporotrichioides]
MTSPMTVMMRPTTSRSILPIGIQLKILDHLIVEGKHDLSFNVSTFAPVSKCWQEVVERELFRSLTLNQLDLKKKKFAAYSKGRTHLVKHILVELLFCNRIGNSPNRRIFTKAMQRLFNVLSVWDGHGITLELGVTSPVESAAVCPPSSHVHVMPLLPRKRSSDPPSSHMGVFEIPEEVLWGLPGLVWHVRAVSLLGQKLLEFRTSAPPLLPEAKCISKLLIRRRYCPSIKPSSLARIIKALPSLKSVHIERWCYGIPPIDTKYHIDFMCYFKLPRSVKDLSFYEENNTRYHYGFEIVDVVEPNFNVIKALVEKSDHLENIAVSFAFEAATLFTPQFAIEFKELKTLALTSQVLVSHTDDSINDLLCLVAKAAKRMPKLDILELWYFKKFYRESPRSRPSRVAIFTYQKLARYNSCISWKSTWSFKMSEETQEQWKDVVDVEGARLSKEHLVLDPDQMFSVGAVHDHLALRDRILHDITWTQV